ncbi:GNAT family protein [Oerskovia jenensis]|uniref:RimJ/RimL family protein N-acetyltransferase n=1 Tax=Oerskovia jenensis TaxID=162169 RepID=A0ABS2LC33_9CELL|nr:GNAT family protein [Oerskovia jenensis]MBM7477988.1 RimJ/RimL family protein N-acetyltransferase [Oerskovia jenensis]
MPVYGVGHAARLRGWRPADLAVFREWLRPHHEWHEWDGPYYPVPDDAQADARVAAIAQTPHGVVDGLPPRSAVIADADDHLVGTVSWYWESQETAWARMGIGVYDPAVRGRGIGREALALWTTYLFSATDWARLDFATWSGNAPMLGVGRRLGFVEEGRFRDARIVRGRRYDSVVMGVLRSEWDARG